MDLLYLVDAISGGSPMSYESPISNGSNYKIKGTRTKNLNSIIGYNLPTTSLFTNDLSFCKPLVAFSTECRILDLSIA